MTFFICINYFYFLDLVLEGTKISNLCLRKTEYFDITFKLFTDNHRGCDVILHLPNNF